MKKMRRKSGPGGGGRRIRSNSKSFDDTVDSLMAPLEVSTDVKTSHSCTPSPSVMPHSLSESPTTTTRTAASPACCAVCGASQAHEPTVEERRLIQLQREALASSRRDLEKAELALATSTTRHACLAVQLTSELEETRKERDEARQELERARVSLRHSQAERARWGAIAQLSLIHI